MGSPRLQKYKKSSPFGFHHEKIALIKLAQHLGRQGWAQVLLSVKPTSLDGEWEGVDPAALNEVDLKSDEIFSPAFRSLFDNDLHHRYKFYRDNPGGIDLVARRGNELLLVEAKGTGRDRKGALDQLIGRQVSMRMDGDPRSFGILVPNTWAGILPPWRQSLAWLKVFLIERDSGAIEEARLPER